MGQTMASPSRVPSPSGPPSWLHVFAIAHSSPDCLSGAWTVAIRRFSR
jgi:hypothetical protein